MDAVSSQEGHIMQVVIYVQEFVEMRKAALDRINKCKNENLCVACMGSLEGEKRVIRGCHYRCQQATLKAIKEGRFTEKGRVQAGKFLPKSGGRPVSNPVSMEAAS
jgi:hypothetical protein